MKVTEADWQRTVVETARLYGWRVAHFAPARTAKGYRTPVRYDGQGFPDLVLVRDRVLFVELKSETGRLSAHQNTWLARLQAAGQEAYVWRPYQWPEVQDTLRRRDGHGMAPAALPQQDGLHDTPRS